LPKLVPWKNSALFAQISAVIDGFMSPSDEMADRTMFITKDLFAVVPMGIVFVTLTFQVLIHTELAAVNRIKSIFLGPGWRIAFPTFHTVHHNVRQILDDFMALDCTDFSIYTADISAIISYLESLNSSEEGRKRRARYLDKLRNLPAIPVGGSKIERTVMAKAIKLGIKVQVTMVRLPSDRDQAHIPFRQHTGLRRQGRVWQAIPRF
jgi:hypothetical protein